MAQFIYEGRTGRQLTGHERIAKRNIRYAADFIIGGYYNCIEDGCPEYLPKTRNDLEEEIYASALQNLYEPGYEGYNKAPKEIRFAGETFCKAYVKFYIDHYAFCELSEIAEYLGWQ